jgi:hypothetical protein
MALVPFAKDRVPEVDFRDTDGVRTLFPRSRNVPGLVMRQVGSDHRKAYDDIAQAIDPDIRLGMPLYSVSFPVEDESSEGFGLHVDMHEVNPDAEQLNIYVLKRGLVAVDIFVLNALFAETIRTDRNPSELTLGEQTRDYRTGHRVDDTLVKPVVYSTQLQPGDALAFWESQVAHNFTSLTDEVRHAVATISSPTFTSVA